MDKKNIKFMVIALFVSIVIAALISPFASSDPDGLEKVGEDQGFLEHAEQEGVTVWESSPVPGYEVPGVKSEFMKTGLAGLIGTVVIFIIGFFFAKVISKKKAAINNGHHRVEHT